jgi:hypothetical protein
MYEAGTFWGGFYTGLGIGVVLGAVAFLFLSIGLGLRALGRTPRPDGTSKGIDEKTERIMGVDTWTP